MVLPLLLDKRGAGVSDSAGAGAAVAWTPESATPDGEVSPALWLLADDLSGNDGDAIASWVSKEGNAYDFAQATADKQPLLKKGANGINSKNVVRFDGANDILVYPAADISNVAQGVVFAVYRLSASPSDLQTVLGSSDEATAAGHYFILRGYAASTRQFIEIATTSGHVVRGSTTIAADTPYLGAWYSDGAAYSLRVNGTDETEVVFSGNNNGNWTLDVLNEDNFTVGAMKWNAEAQFLKGDVAEIIMYNAALSADDISTLEGYLSTRYDITLNP